MRSGHRSCPRRPCPSVRSAVPGPGTHGRIATAAARNPASKRVSAGQRGVTRAERAGCKLSARPRLVRSQHLATTVVAGVGSSLRTSRTGVSRQTGQPRSALSGSAGAACLTSSRTTKPDRAGMSKARLVIMAVTVEKRPPAQMQRLQVEVVRPAAAGQWPGCAWRPGCPCGRRR
jgi:hypothetical protein